MELISDNILTGVNSYLICHIQNVFRSRSHVEPEVQHTEYKMYLINLTLCGNKFKTFTTDNITVNVELC
jgi:hypothetical protein